MTPLIRGSEHFGTNAFTASTSQSTPTAFTVGTGLSLYEELLLPAVLSSKHEVVLATCFWAPSATLDKLVSTLKQLSANTLTSPSNYKIRVYICFSSRSAVQKLFHTSSSDGYIYPSNAWCKKLGLPSPEEVPGLEILVKSLFFRPFSVLHSKYLIIDRQKVFLPSCNVSWEEWYECCIGFEGPVVQHVFQFWQDVWRPEGLADLSSGKWDHDTLACGAAAHATSKKVSEQTLRTTLLPHPHNASLRQALWLLPKRAPVPATPLNETLQRLIMTAKREVILLTPNFTSMSVFTAIGFALWNGANVHLITNRRMMIPEQLATAGVLTEQYVKRLITEYRKGLTNPKVQKELAELAESRGQAQGDTPYATSRDGSQLKTAGTLRVSYFRQPQRDHHNHSASVDIPFGVASLCTKSHIKLTLIDGTSIVLGSGNMDSASWRTSQELGVLLQDQDEVGQATGEVKKLWAAVEKGLEGCLEAYFDTYGTVAASTELGG